MASRASRMSRTGSAAPKDSPGQANSSSSMPSPGVSRRTTRGQIDAAAAPPPNNSNHNSATRIPAGQRPKRTNTQVKPRKVRDYDDDDYDEDDDAGLVYEGNLPDSFAHRRVRFLMSADLDDDADADDDLTIDGGVDMVDVASRSPSPASVSASPTGRSASPMANGSAAAAQHQHHTPSTSPTPRGDGDDEAHSERKAALHAAPSKPKDLTALIEEIQRAPIPRKPIQIPELPPRRPKIELEDLPPFQRPTLRAHRTEDARMVRVLPVINDRLYAEQLIDARQTLVKYGPPPQLTHTPSIGMHGMGSPGYGHMMSPLGAQRLVLGNAASNVSSLPPGASLLNRQFSLGQSSPSIASRKSLPHLPPLHTLPGSPTPRGLNNVVGLPSTPYSLHRQASALTLPMPVQVPIGPKSNIVTQLIPYGRIQILPQRRSVLCASSVPLTSAPHSWYLPPSHPNTLYITLDLPGHIDYEIKLENVFVLPDDVDFGRLKVQQRMIYEGKLDLQSTHTDVAGNKQRSNAASATGGATTNAVSTGPNKSATRSSRRVGGHLERKKRKRLSEDDQLALMAQPHLSDSDEDPLLTSEFTSSRSSSGLIPFGPPSLTPVKVSMKSKGQDLIPRPAHTAQETRAGNTLARTIPRGPCVLSPSNPTIAFSHGSITLERMKPRLGGWVVKREVTMQAAREYKQVAPLVKSEDAATTVKSDVVKTEPMDTDPPVVVKSDPVGLGARYDPVVKSEPMSDVDPPRKVTFDPDGFVDEIPPKDAWQVEYAATHTQPAATLHDIAEVGDVIRLVINAPEPPPQAKSKRILPMRYELLIEGIRIAAAADAPTFPATSELYRPGTAPKSVIESEALNPRLTSSMTPSTRIPGVDEPHWINMGREPTRRDPLIFPATWLPSDDDAGDDEASDSDDDSPRASISAAAKAAQVRGKFFADFPQSNFNEYFQLSARDTTLIDDENAELDRSDDSDDEEVEDYQTTESSDTSDGEQSVGSVEHAVDEHGRRQPPGSGRAGRKRDRTEASTHHNGGRTTDMRGDHTKSQHAKSSVNNTSTSASHANGRSSSSNRAPQSSRSSVPPVPVVSAYEPPTEAVWVACDRCGKWRKMPPGTNPDSLDKVWYCHMNPDVTRNSCKHAEEEDPDAGTGSFATKEPNQSSKAKKDAEPTKPAAPTRESIAAQAAHLNSLFPCPKLPTTEDVCTECEQPLAPPTDSNTKVTEEANTLFCHGPCARMWHRACATIVESSKSHVAVSLPSGPFKPLDASQPGLTPHPSTHVTPFTPLTTPYWYCSECLALKNSCFSCYKPGTIDPTLYRIQDGQHGKRWSENPAMLKQCPHPAGCGRFYHSKCLFELSRTMTHKGTRVGASKDTVTLTPNLVPRPRAPLICALHMCASCNGAGTVSTNVRDVGRTLVQCVRCSEAYHWSSKCRHDDTMKLLTKKFGICDGHETGDDSDCEDADVRQQRLESKKGITLAFTTAPQHLFGSEPVEPSSSEEESEEEDDEDEEDEEEEEETNKKK